MTQQIQYCNNINFEIWARDKNNQIHESFYHLWGKLKVRLVRVDEVVRSWSSPQRAPPEPASSPSEVTLLTLLLVMLFPKEVEALLAMGSLNFGAAVMPMDYIKKLKFKYRTLMSHVLD